MVFEDAETGHLVLRPIAQASGLSRVHASRASGQRVWNRQHSGGSAGSGMSMFRGDPCRSMWMPTANTGRGCRCSGGTGPMRGTTRSRSARTGANTTRFRPGSTRHPVSTRDLRPTERNSGRSRTSRWARRPESVRLTSWCTNRPRGRSRSPRWVRTVRGPRKRTRRTRYRDPARSAGGGARPRRGPVRGRRP